MTLKAWHSYWHSLISRWTTPWGCLHVPSVPDMKTVGCVCPNLQRFAAEAHPSFCHYSGMCDQKCPTYSIHWCSRYAMKTPVFSSSVMAVTSSNVHRSRCLTVNNCRWASHSWVNWLAKGRSALASSKFQTGGRVTLMKKGISDVLAKWSK